MSGQVRGRVRLNWGCGGVHPAGWVSSDRGDDGQEHVGDIREGLPWDAETFDFAVSHHALQMLDYLEVVPALAELRRVLKPAGVLRLSVPNVVAGVRAHARGDLEWFPALVGEETTLDGRFCAWVTDYGRTRTVFTHGRLEEYCARAGFELTARASCGHSPLGGRLEGICDLDGRCAESAYVEARR